MIFRQKLIRNINKNKSLLCLGLDSFIEKLPDHLKIKKYPQFAFNKALIDATYDLVCAYKPNTAFYEMRGAAGIKELKLTCDYIKQNYPEAIIILDAKRADIGNTNAGYVYFTFEYLGADAITLHPYLGQEALTPFLAKKDKGCIILCRTSNPGATEFQDLKIKGEPLYKIVAKKVIRDWNYNNNCLLVIGATYPEELREIRELSDELTFLVPGIGAQGGNIKKTMSAGINSKKSGLIINSSRSIIFASGGKDFADKARREAEVFRNEINKYRI